MRLLDLANFREWVQHEALCWDRGPDAPGFGSAERESPWPWPKPDGHVRPWQLANLIVDAIRAATLNEQGGFYLWPTYGRWPPGGNVPFYRVRSAILVATGIPVGFLGAVYFSEGEADSLAAAVFARCFMIDDQVGDAGDGAFVYPSHGRLYLHFDDEEITWGMAARAEPLAAFDEGLRRLGWGWLRDKGRNQWGWPLTEGDPNRWSPASPED